MGPNWIQLSRMSFSWLQATSEKMCRLYEDQMNEAKAKVDELQRQLNETNTQRARVQAESGKELSFYSKSHKHFTNQLVTKIWISPSHAGEVSRKLEEREAMVSQLQRAKNSFSQNVEELKKQLEEENKVSSLSVHQWLLLIKLVATSTEVQLSSSLTH